MSEGPEEGPESNGSGLEWFRVEAQDIYAITPYPPEAGDAEAWDDDEAECPETLTRTHTCLRCGGLVAEEDKGSHLKEHSNDGIGYSFQEVDESDPLLYLDSQGRCRECGELIPEGRRLNHIHDCPERLEICYWCFSLVRANNFIAHELSGHCKYIVSPAFVERDVVFGDFLRPFSNSKAALERYLGLLAFIALGLAFTLLCTYFVFNANQKAAGV